jgi:hypothetical protein
MEFNPFKALERVCEAEGLACYSNEILKAVALPAAIITTAAAVTAYVKHKWNWNADIREHCQNVVNRQQFCNAMILVIGALTTALSAIGAIGLGATAVATILSGIWLGVGTCLVLNTVLHNRLASQHAARMI